MKRFLLAVVLGCILISSSFAYAAGQGRNSVAVAGGLAKPENIDATWYVTAGVRLHVDDNWAIEPDFGYWKQDEAEVFPTVTYSLRDIHAGGNILYIGSWGDIGMYGGGGAAVHWRKREAEVDTAPPTNPTLDETRLGLQILWGIDIPVAHSVDYTVAIRDYFIFRDDDLDTKTLFKAYGGLRFYID